MRDRRDTLLMTPSQVWADSGAGLPLPATGCPFDQVFDGSTTCSASNRSRNIA